MFFYFLFTLAIALKSPPVKFVGSIIVLLFIGSFFRDLIFDMRKQPVLYFLLDGVMLNFVFGMILGHMYQREIFLGRIGSVSAITLGLMSIVFDIFSIVIPIPSLIGIGIASFFVIWGCISLERLGRITIPPIFVFLGAASYSTYLFHPLIMPIVPTIFKKLGLLNPYLATVSAVVLALVVTSAIYFLLERPITNFLSVRLSHGRAAAS